MTGRGRAAGHDLRSTGVEPVTRSSLQRLLDVLPFLIMGAVAGATLAFGPRSGLLQLLALGPAFAAVSGGLRKTIAAGVVALVLNALLAADQVISTWGDYARDSAVVVGVTVAAVIACTVRQRREHELAEVRAIAEVAQQVLLGPVPDAARSVRLAVRYMSATSHARIGGDLYEVVTGATGMRLIIGDVQGKGLVAVKTAATVLGLPRPSFHIARVRPCAMSARCSVSPTMRSRRSPAWYGAPMRVAFRRKGTYAALGSIRPIRRLRLRWDLPSS